jgi:hypothetical protein
MTNPAVISHRKLCHCQNFTLVISHHKNCRNLTGRSSVIIKSAIGPECHWSPPNLPQAWRVVIIKFFVSVG